MFRTRYVFCLVALLAATSANAQGRPPRDAINLSQVHIYNSPTDVASWPVTTAITSISMRPSFDPVAGLALQFSGLQTWPDYTPPGWDGPLQYTVWAIWYANGQWSASGIIQMWRGRASTGGPIMTDFARNWIYDSRWGPDWGHQPVPGELMGFFVTAGNARGVGGVTSVRERSNVVTVAVPGNDYGDYTFPMFGRSTTTNDFDGDGISDAILFRPSDGTWYIGKSSTLTGVGVQWGTAGDIPAAGDYDGDGLTDVAVFRPSTGTWYIRDTATGAVTASHWGMAGDIPVPGDYDGDGKTDMAVFRPSNGAWCVWQSSTQTALVTLWGVGSDVPVPGDYDRDGRTDIAVYRPSEGVWYVWLSATSTAVGWHWGGPGDIPVKGDYDGDGGSDLAIFRPSTGTWWIYGLYTGVARVLQWGTAGDIPVGGDFDGDGKTDIAVFRPSNGTWYGFLSATSTGRGLQWGMSGDIPTR